MELQFGTTSGQSTKNVSRTYALPGSGARPSWSSTKVLKWYGVNTDSVFVTELPGGIGLPDRPGAFVLRPYSAAFASAELPPSPPS